MFIEILYLVTKDLQTFQRPKERTYNFKKCNANVLSKGHERKSLPLFTLGELSLLFLFCIRL